MEQENLQHDEDVNKDSEAIQDVINKVKSQGLFDQFRKECLADVDTKPAYHNLIQRVEKFVERFLNGQKWTSNVNKNQLRETLRRQLNNSGIMSIGVDRIIEQVVNPKILLGIKPKIDEAVCDHLGIDQKARQEEQQRRKQEKQRLMLQQQQLQQQHLQNMMNPNMKNGDTFSSGSGILPTPNDLSWSPANPNFLGGSGPGMGPGSGVPYNMGFGGMMQPFSFMGPWAPGLPGMEGFNQTMNPLIPGQPMIPPFPQGLPDPSTPFNTSPRPAKSTPDFSKPPPGLPTTPLHSSSSSIASSPGVPGVSVQSSPVGPPGIHPPAVGPIIRPPPPGSVPPPPGTVPVMPPLIPPGASMAPPVSPLLRPNVPTTPNIPALISHTLSKVSKDELTPEKIAVFKTAAAFITKTVNNAQGTPGADLATMFSPRVLAEAMMAESGAPMTKHEIRAAKRKERMKEFERLKAERDKEEAKRKAEEKADEDPLPPKHNLMDVFQAAEDVSDDEDSFNMLIEGSETEDKHKQGVVLSDDSDKGEEEQPPTSQPGKRYNFAWDVDKDELSDVTVSSIHTSDISSFESSQSESEDGDKPTEKLEEKDSQADEEGSDSEVNASQAELQEVGEKSPEARPDPDATDENKENSQDKLKEKQINLISVGLKQTRVLTKEGSSDLVKPRKLVSLSYKYSDSDEEETREERKARIAKEKEERYLKRQQRRAELEAKRKEREDEKVRLKEEKKKLREEKKMEAQKEEVTDEATKVEDTTTSATSTNEQESPNKASPRKRRKKAEIKEQLHQQKVLERKAALSRQRTRNRRYASEEFTSIFTERKTLNQSYADPPQDIVTFDSSLEIVEMTVDQECIVETVGETVELQDVDKTDDLTLQCPSPYSDISDKSMSDKSDEQAMAVEMEQVSSDEDLDSGDDDSEDDASKDMKSSVEADESEVSQEFSARNMTPSRSSSLVAGDLFKDGQEKRKSPELSDSRSIRSQRYDVDDLYKPRTSRRRATTPPYLPLENKFHKVPSDTLSDDEKSSQKSNSIISQTVIHTTELDVDKSCSEEPTLVEVGDAASVKEPVDMMAELELEPVSDEEISAVDDMDKEDGEEKDSDEAASTVKRETLPETTAGKSTPGQAEDDEASDEGEIKSDSEESKADSPEEKERAVYRKPIELVDFGEAEKRARGSRGFFPEVAPDRRNLRNPAPVPTYRGSYTWTASEASSYIPSVQRYPVSHEGVLTSHSKSPLGYDGAESEASSHSRSSVRLRDDVPPPYPIEGVNTRKRRSPTSEHGAASSYKPVSPPSPVSSSSSSRSVRSTSSSRSSSRSSSDSSSSSSHSSRRKKKHQKKKRRQRGSSRDKELSAARQSFPTSKSLENLSPVKVAEPMLKVASEPQIRERLLSSGHESISSDELPYFPDDEPVPPPSPPKVKVKRKRSSRGDSSSGSSSSASSLPMNKKRKGSQSPGKESISSSDLIYSPTRLNKSPDRAEGEEEDDDNVSIERPPMSPGRSSISSGELPDYPDQDLQGFSPHCPPLPQEDIDGFQPPLPPSPQSFDANPPLPPPPPEPPQLPSSDEEDGEIIEETQQIDTRRLSYSLDTHKLSYSIGNNERMSSLEKSFNENNPSIEKLCEDPTRQYLLPSLETRNNSSLNSIVDSNIPLPCVSEQTSSPPTAPSHSEASLDSSSESKDQMVLESGLDDRTSLQLQHIKDPSNHNIVQPSPVCPNTSAMEQSTVVEDSGNSSVVVDSEALPQSAHTQSSEQSCDRSPQLEESQCAHSINSITACDADAVSVTYINSPCPDAATTYADSSSGYDDVPETKLDNDDLKLDQQEAKLDQQEAKLEEGKLDQQESKLEESKLDQQESKLEESKLDQLESKLEESKLDQLESKLEEEEAKLDNQDSHLDQEKTKLDQEAEPDNLDANLDQLEVKSDHSVPLPKLAEVGDDKCEETAGDSKGLIDNVLDSSDSATPLELPAHVGECQEKDSAHS